MIDIERLASDYLRDHPDINARVVGKTPSSTSTAWVRVTLLDAPSLPSSPVDHLIAHLTQFDCYAGAQGGQPEAILLARTVRAALAVMPDESFADAVVSSVRFTGHTRLPDQAWEPARERVVITAQVWAHPTS